MPFGPGCPWYSMQQTFGLPNVKWCEETVCSLVNEPANAWSNLAYMIPGLLYWLHYRKRGERDLAWLALSSLIMGLFSFIYHATNNALTQYFDFLGMYLYVFFIIALNLIRAERVETGRGMLGYGIAVAALILGTVAARQIDFPIQVIVLLGVFGIIASERMAHQAGNRPADYRAFLGFGASFAIAICFSGADKARLMCDPHNHLLQGHALWHIFGGIGTIFSFHHYALVLRRHPLPRGARTISSMQPS